MKEGDVALARLQLAEGGYKNRPVILLRQMPPFGDWLVCGVSTQLQQEVAGFDEVITPADSDFSQSGLKAASLIRLGYLAVLPGRDLPGVIGSVSPERHARLRQRLGQHLQ